MGSLISVSEISSATVKFLDPARTAVACKHRDTTIMSTSGKADLFDLGDADEFRPGVISLMLAPLHI
jgi:hypothetical protein